MKVSVEISYYPLNEEYVTHIKGFIQQLNLNPNIVVRTNSMSTQIFGDYEEVMNTLTPCIKDAFNLPHSVFVMKVINADLS